MNMSNGKFIFVPVVNILFTGQTKVFDDICVYCYDTEVIETEYISQLSDDFRIV